MKRILIYAFALFSVIAAVCSCDKDSNDEIVPDDVLSLFEEMFPSAKHVRWSEVGGYYRAQCVEERISKVAWFGSNGQWLMTDVDLPAQNLPRPIHTSLAVGEFSGKRIEKIYYVTAPERAELYVIVMNVGENALVSMYYTKSGNLIKKEVPEDLTPDIRPVPLTPQMEEAVSAYDGLLLTCVEARNDTTEVCMANDSLSVIAGFGTADSALLYEWKHITEGSYPAGLEQAVAEKGYTMQQVKRVYVVTAGGARYNVVIVSGGDGYVAIRIDGLV